MNPRWREIDRLFEAALELPAGDREVFVRRDAGDTETAEEVLVLLRTAPGEDVPQPSLDARYLMEALATILLDGKVLSHYRVGDMVGEGGMGMVYEGTDERDGSKVAIKILRPEQARQPARLARFQREAKAMASLAHPAIARIREAGSTQGIHYLVMEFLEGETLGKRLSRAGPLPEREVLECGLAIASALQTAHRAGVTHRDLKPENVMLTENGPKVFDFGLARLAESNGDDRTTLEGTLAGTLAYVAPEQVDGSSGTAQSDIFALGVVLFEASTGKPLFLRGNSFATAMAIRNETPDYEKVAPSLRPVLQRCLEKDSKRRYESCEQVLADLEKVRAGIRVSPRRRIGPIIGGVAAMFLAAMGTWRFAEWRSGRPDPKAVAQVGLGKYHLSRRTQTSILKAADYFREARRIDPGYAVADAWLANSLSLLPEYGINEPKNAMEGRAAARRAIQREPNLSIAHTALGWILFSHDWRWGDAEQEFRKGVELAPAEPLPHQRYGLALAARGRFAEAEAELTRAQQLDPFAISPMINLAELWFYARRFDREEAQLRAILDRDPGSAVAMAMMAKMELFTGRARQGIEEMKHLLALPEGGSWCAELAELYALNGQRDASLQQVASCGPGAELPTTLFALGERKRALDALERSCEARDTNMAFVGVDPDFDGMREVPAFRQILGKVVLQ